MNEVEIYRKLLAAGNRQLVCGYNHTSVAVLSSQLNIYVQTVPHVLCFYCESSKTTKKIKLSVFPLAIS